MQYRQTTQHGCPVYFDHQAPYPLPPKKEQHAPDYQEIDPRAMPDKEYAAPYAPMKNACTRERTPGMVYHKPHDLCQMYEPMQALKNGTLFHELNKPLLHCGMGDTRPKCTQDQALAFAAWELRLYLNTHPCDQRALDAYWQLCQENVGMQYAWAFMPRRNGGRTWEWVQDPWPWEYDAQCDWRG